MQYSLPDIRRMTGFLSTFERDFITWRTSAAKKRSANKVSMSCVYGTAPGLSNPPCRGIDGIIRDSLSIVVFRARNTLSATAECRMRFRQAEPCAPLCGSCCKRLVDAAVSARIAVSDGRRAANVRIRSSSGSKTQTGKTLPENKA